AVAGIFAAKQRPAFNPLISHLAGVEAVEHFALWNEAARALAATFWPGALTLVLPRIENCPIADITSAGLDSVALRVPSHPAAHAMLVAVDRPVAAPSANRSGRISPTTAAHVAEELGDEVAMILDGGPCTIGLESTVVGFHQKQSVLLRPGGIPVEQLEAVVGTLRRPLTDPSVPCAPSSPGQLASHYAPNKPLRLNVNTAGLGEVLLGFGPDSDTPYNLSPTADLIEAAANLFAMLRQLDQGRGDAIAVAPIPEFGLGLAINDRLRRAAAPRT
ncbi:MAG: threonylcarbamoyl-AMP synthase, partial [Rhodospirillaceae bacterium]|nr:threonylcarbamoyl-AMP synthase [Rhodospirillaceae bacterium]